MAFDKCTECGEAGHPWWDHDLKPGFKFGEEPMEPYLDWQLDPHGPGIEVTTRSQKRKIMDKHDLEPSKPRSHPGQKLFFDMKR